MAEGRMLKRKITCSKKLAALKSDKARLLWFYMLPFTDVDGRIVADCEDIKDEILRKQRRGYSLAKIEECLQDLWRVGLIVLYEVNNNRYLEFTRFWDEQTHNPDREAKSAIPSPTQGTLQEHSESTPLKLSKVKLSKDKYTQEFEIFWKKYPERWIPKSNKHVKIGKEKAWEQWQQLGEETHKLILCVLPVYSRKISAEIIPDPWRWLRDKKWKDYEPVPQPKSQESFVTPEPKPKRQVARPKLKNPLKKVPSAKLTQAEFNKRRQEQLRALEGTK